MGGQGVVVRRTGRAGHHRALRHRGRGLRLALRREGDPDDAVGEVGHGAGAGQTQLGGVASPRPARLREGVRVG